MTEENKQIRISVVMIDGGFREKVFGGDYFSRQNFPDEEYEIIWVDYFDKIHPEVMSLPKVKTIPLGRKGIYHSSYCFNRGIKEARGEIIVIPDADLIVASDFLDRVWGLHQQYEKLVTYGYRYDEEKQGILESHDLDELDRKCIMKNPFNFGGCLTVRKKWLLQMNGYEQHPVFRTGFHANGMLMSSRFKNMGLAIQWEPTLKLYHPWHPFTLASSIEYKSQFKIIDWIRANMQWLAIQGMDSTKNLVLPAELNNILESELSLLDNAILEQWDISSIAEFPENSTQPLDAPVSPGNHSGILSNIYKKLIGAVK